MKRLKSVGVALMAVLLVAGVLWATDNTFNLPVATQGGLSTGDIIYARDANHLGNISGVATGSVLCSAGLLTQPTWCSTIPVTTSISAPHYTVPGTTPPTCATNCGTSPSVVGSDSAGVITLGGTPSNAFIVTFASTFTASPSCNFQQQTSAANYVTKSLTTPTQVTVSVAAGPTAADKFSYVCVGVQ